MIKPHLQDGIPEFRLPKMNPLTLPEVGLDAGAGFIAKFEAHVIFPLLVNGKLTSSLQNVEIYDADKFVIKKFDVNLAENKIKFDLTFPHIRIKAQYSIFGKVLFFNLDGSGPADGNISKLLRVFPFT